MDGLGLEACHLIKLDIEGMEVEALRGAEKTIGAHRPILYVENDRQDRSEELLGLLLASDYRLYWHITWLFSSSNYNNDPENIFGNVGSFNVLCLPRERGVSVIDMPEILSATETAPQ